MKTKKSWDPFSSYLLNSTANPAHFHRNWAELAVLFSRQIPNGSHDFFQTFSTQWIFLLYRWLQKIEQVESDHCDRYQNNRNKNCN